MTNVDFKGIRSHAGSQNEAFEELTAQLFFLKKPHPEAQWIRKRGAGGDGGVEAYWLLPDGKENCLQSKFFFELGSAQRTQMTRSVKKMLEKHPNCTQYTIAIPFNLTDGKVKKKKSERDYWKDLVADWKAFAPDRDIEFVLWDETLLNTDLMRDEPEYTGRRKYWFDDIFLSDAWIQKRLVEAVANLGDRYTPEMHVDLPLAKRFGAAMRHTEFWDSLEDVPSLPSQTGKTDSLKQMEAEVIAHADAFCGHVARAVTTCTLGRHIAAAKNSAESAESAAIQKIGVDGWPEDEFKNQERSAYFRLRDTASYYSQHLKEHHVEMAEAPAIYLTGSAGSGKSHLLADVATKAVSCGYPAILILGQQFQSGLPWPFILNALDLDVTTDEFLGALDAAGQAHNCRAVLAIDALNEGRGNMLWPATLSGFAEKVARFPNIVLIVSCRETYDRRIRKNVTDEQFLILRHHGFLGHEEAAAKAYMDGQNISRQDAPFLDPEFSNPLFLKTICAAVKRKGESSFPKGLRGVTAIFDYYISSVTDAIEYRLDLDPDLGLVRSVIKLLLDEMLGTGLNYVAKARAYEIAETVLSANGDAERNLIRQLKSEGVLSDDMAYPNEDDDEGIDVIRVSYERYLDHFRAERFITDHVDPDNLQAAFKLGGPLYMFLGARFYEHAGFLDALSIQMPERFGSELFDLVELDPAQKFPSLRTYLEDSFEESICWRDPTKTNDDTLRLLNDLFGGLTSKTFSIMMRCATDPDHAFNAHCLHQNLMKLEMVKRDSNWTHWIVSQWYSPEEGQHTTPVWRMIDWAMSVDGEALDNDRLILAATALAWMLASPNRSLRDQATKSLSKILGRNAHVARRLLLSFDRVDDDYILSRVYAAAYAVALRMPAAGLRPLASTVVNRVFRGRKKYGHILLQDYVRGITALADRNGQLPDNFSVEEIEFQTHSDWPMAAASPSEAEALKEQLGRVYWSVMSGDFGTYIMNDVFGFSTTPISQDQIITRADQWQLFLDDLSAANPAAPGLIKAQMAAQSIERDHDRNRVGVLTVEIDGGSLKTKTSDGADYDEAAHEEAKRNLKEADEALKSTLTEDQREAWRWLSGMRSSKDAAIFSRRIAKRWVLKRVADFGFVQKDFDQFERNYAGSHGRSSHTNERMGKKYQWIAFHQLMANLAANVHYVSRWEDENGFEGAWQIYERNIDPTLTATPERQKEPKDGFWWAADLERLDDEMTPEEGGKWVRDTSSLPANFDGCEALEPISGRELIVLENFVSARGKRAGYKPNDRICNQSVTSIIVKKGDAAKLLKKLKETNLAGDFRNPREYSGDAFLLEYPWHPAWYPLPDAFETLDLRNGAAKEIDVHYPYRVYSHENSGYDSSMDRSLSVNMPSQILMNGLGLKLDIESLTFTDSCDRAVFYDPGVFYDSISSVVVDKAAFSKWLRENEYVLVTSITLMKQFTLGTHETFMGELTDCQLITYGGDQRTGERWSILTEMGPSDSVLRKAFKI